MKKREKFLISLIKSPYYIIKYIILGIYYLVYWIIKAIIWIIRKIRKKKEEIKEKRERKFKAIYEKFEVIDRQKGDFNKWEKDFYKSDSKIGIILGARGTGKTAFGIKMLENCQVKASKKCYAIGFEEKDMPEWINVVSSPNEIKNDSIVLIDEGGVLFSSRKSMSSANKLLSDLMLISRHKNISILFISQNSSNLDVNIIRQADFLILKTSSLLQKDFERKIIGKIYENLTDKFSKYKDNKGLTYIYSDLFRGFISNNLPSFWKTSISKSFR